MKTMKSATKHLFATLLFSMICIGMAYSQEKQEYTEAMANTLAQMGSVSDHATYLDLANQFQRISEKETSEWLPAYYSALNTILYSFGEKDGQKVDPALDQAQLLIDKAQKIKADESELWVLQGLLHQARIMVDPMTRGQKFSQQASEAFDKAEALNANNPRIYYLRGQSIMNTPKAFGGGKEAAKPLFLKAQEKFENFKPSGQFAPNWGKEMNEESLKSCENN